MSDTALLRIGILAAGLLLIAAIFLFGRPKKKPQGRRVEGAEPTSGERREPVLGEDGVAVAEGRVEPGMPGEGEQAELGLGETDPGASDLGKRATQDFDKIVSCSWPPGPANSCVAKTSWWRPRRPAWCSAT